MDELISRQAAIDALKRAEALTRTFGYHHVIETIRELPSAEPRKGKWIYDPELYPMGGAYGHYECDQCGEWIRGSMTNYCPNCGARMEESE